MKKFPLTWLELVSWKQNIHREDQRTLRVAEAYPVMVLQVLSTGDTTPFRHHPQKGFLQELRNSTSNGSTFAFHGAEHSDISLKQDRWRTMTENVHFSTKSRTHILALTELFIIFTTQADEKLN